MGLVDKQSADFNEVTNSTNEDESAKTEAVLMKEENDDIHVSTSNDKQAQICKENKAPECNSSSVETKILFDKYQFALYNKYCDTYFHNAVEKYKYAALNAMYEEPPESSESYSDEFYESDSDIEVTICIRTLRM